MIETGDQQFDQSQATSLSSGVEQGAGREKTSFSQSKIDTWDCFPNYTSLFSFLLKKEITRQKGIVFSIVKRIFPFFLFK